MLFARSGPVGFLSHLRSLRRYDEQEILHVSLTPIYLVNADAGQSGAPSAIAAGLTAAAPGNDMVMAGLPPEDVFVDFTGQVVLRKVALYGIYGRLIDRTWLGMERALLSGLDVEGVITHSFPLEDFDEAIRTARIADAGKVFFDMSDIS